jgi:hypothetical protein
LEAGLSKETEKRKGENREGKIRNRKKELRNDDN